MRRFIANVLAVALIAGLTFVAGYGFGHDTAQPEPQMKAKNTHVELIPPAKPLKGWKVREA